MTHQELVDLVQAQQRRIETLETNVARGFQRLHASQLALTAGLEEAGKVIGQQMPPPPENPARAAQLDALALKIRALGAEMGVVVHANVFTTDGHSHLAISIAPGTPDELIRAFNAKVTELNEKHGTYARAVGKDEEVN